MSFELFTSHTTDEHATSIGQYLPGGPLFNSSLRPDTTFRKFLVGLGQEFQRAEEQLGLLSSEIDPRSTTLFIEEWEQNVGIPDSCFIVANTLEERRTNILIKLVSSGVQTEQDFIDLGALLGFTITIEQPVESFVLPQIVPFIVNSIGENRFIWIVKGDFILTPLPQIVPFIVGGTETTVLECVFNLLKPATTFIIFEPT